MTDAGMTGAGTNGTRRRASSKWAWIGGGVLAAVGVVALWRLDKANAGEPALPHASSAPRREAAERNPPVAEELASAPSRIAVDLAAGDEPSDAPRGSLRVRVVRASDGKPVADARAWIENERASPKQLQLAAARFGSDVAELANEVGIELPLDASGETTAPEPQQALRVAARAPGLAGWTVAARGDLECVVRLEPSHDLVVKFEDAQGRPCEGAYAGVFVVRNFEAWRQAGAALAPVLVARSDSNGVALLRDVESHTDGPQATWIVQPLLVGATPDGYNIDPRTPLETKLEFTLHAYGAMEFVLRDSSGAVVEREGEVTLEEPGIRRLSSQTVIAPLAELRGGRAHFPVVGIGVVCTAIADLRRPLGMQRREIPPLTYRGERRSVDIVVPD